MNAPAMRRSESLGYHIARQSDRSRRPSGAPMIRELMRKTERRPLSRLDRRTQAVRIKERN
jgi:hypothetical protein